MVRYRYFLCLLPSISARRQIDAIRADQGWTHQIVEADRLHMTLVMMTVTDAPWHQCAAQLSAALSELTLPACTVRLDTLVRGMLVSRERLSGIHKLRSDIVGALLRHGLPRAHIPAKLHVSLCYAPHGKSAAPLQPVEWRADRLTLVESHHGEHRHVVLRHWPLSEAIGFPSLPVQLDLWPG